MIINNYFTNNLNLPLLAVGQSHKEECLNESLSRLDALLNTQLIEIGANVPPAQNQNGDLYVIGKEAVDEWAHYVDFIAYYRDGWQYVKPRRGLALYYNKISAMIIYNGDVWQTNSSCINVQADKDGLLQLQNYNSFFYCADIVKKIKIDFCLSLYVDSCWHFSLHLGQNNFNDIIWPSNIKCINKSIPESQQKTLEQAALYQFYSLDGGNSWFANCFNYT